MFYHPTTLVSYLDLKVSPGMGQKFFIVDSGGKAASLEVQDNFEVTMHP